MIPLVALVVIAAVVVAAGVVLGLRAADRSVHGPDDDDTLVDSSLGLAALDERALGLDDLGDAGLAHVAVVRSVAAVAAVASVAAAASVASVAAVASVPAAAPVEAVASVARERRAASDAPRVYGTPPPGHHSVGRLRILIVDDEPQVGRMIARLMHAHEITTVTSGEAALATLAADDRFDAILCDLIMPEMSGVKLAAAIADRHGDLRSRMAFLAGRNVSPDAKRMLAGGDTRWVTKPVQYAQLAICVSEIVSATRAAGDADPPLSATPATATT
jgi:CheY-like chemotaxis protein